MLQQIHQLDTWISRYILVHLILFWNKPKRSNEDRFHHAYLHTWVREQLCVQYRIQQVWYQISTFLKLQSYEMNEKINKIKNAPLLLPLFNWIARLDMWVRNEKRRVAHKGGSRWRKEQRTDRDPPLEKMKKIIKWRRIAFTFNTDR